MTTASIIQPGGRNPAVADTRLLARRLGGRAIDAALLVAVGVALGLAIGFGFDWLAIHAALVFAYFVVLDATVATTLGKRLLGLKLVSPDGDRPTLRQAAIREAFTLAGAVPFVGPLLALVAWTTIAVTSRADGVGQGSHDRLAGGTQVVPA